MDDFFWACGKLKENTGVGEGTTVPRKHCKQAMEKLEPHAEQEFGMCMHCIGL
jgi:hypothetical protein